MTHYHSDFTGLEAENKKHLTGLVFVCPKCKRDFRFEQLNVGIVPPGYDYLCPNDGWWIMVAEEIADRKFPNLKSEVLKREREGDKYVPTVWHWE
jgi:hypothetical protein